MDGLVEMVIAGAPNLVVAVLVLFWQHQRINKLETHILEQNDLFTGRLLEIVKRNELPGGSEINAKP